MIRNKYILPYDSVHNSSIISQEYKNVSTTDIYNCYLERPIKPSLIKKVKEDKMYKIIDSIMCNKKVNSLLYSGNARKISSLYLKQKKYLLRQHVPLKTEEDNLLKKKVLLYSEKVEIQKMMEDIKENIERYHKNKKKYFTKLMKKNDEFINSQCKIDKKLEKLETKSINQIRLKGYKKAFDKCLNLSLTNKNFEMLDLSSKNVFGRLYNNKALSLNHKNKKNYSADKIKTSKETSSRKNYTSFKNLLKDYKSSKNNKINNHNTDYNKYQYHKRKIIKFRLNSNINGIEHNLKQFNVGVTKKILRRCWSSISGGPKNKNRDTEKNIKDKLREKLKQKYDYTILSTRNGGDKNDLSLYNTMVVNDPLLKKNRIKNKNFRDKDNNSALHIAVRNNSIKMVKYLLSKKNKNINAKNNKGQTSLHLACLKGNEAIINLLIQNGANINELDLKGNKPFDLLSSERYKNL